VCQLFDSEFACCNSLFTAELTAGTLLIFLLEKRRRQLNIGVMAVDEKGTSAAEGLIDPNCPVFARLNLEFPQASWTDARHAVSSVICIGDSSFSLNPEYCFVALGSIIAKFVAYADFALRSS